MVYLLSGRKRKRERYRGNGHGAYWIDCTHCIALHCVAVGFGLGSGLGSAFLVDIGLDLLVLGLDLRFEICGICICHVRMIIFNGMDFSSKRQLVRYKLPLLY